MTIITNNAVTSNKAVIQQGGYRKHADLISNLNQLSFKHVSDLKKPELFGKRDTLIEIMGNLFAEVQAFSSKNCLGPLSIEDFIKPGGFQISLGSLDTNEQSIILEQQKELQTKIANALGEKRELEEYDELICCDPAKINQNVEAAEQLLIRKDCGIYQRSGRLVHIEAIPAVSAKVRTKGIIRPPDTILIREADYIFLAQILGKAGRFARWDGRKEDIRAIDCPERISRYLIAKSNWNFQVLSGVINAPTLRSDGSILDKPGYDSLTGLYYSPNGIIFDKIPENPSKDDALSALNEVKELLKEFPFVSIVDESVAISAILAGLVRRSINLAPLHAFTAPKMASGKSLLADIVSLIATGKPNSVISFTDDKAEERKRMLAVLMAGDPIVCYDNIEAPFGGSTLCSVLTQSSYQDRELGKNKQIEVPTNTFFLATGNNLILFGDLTKRALMCRLDPKTEYPERRSFDKDLYEYIPANRHRLVPLCLTILRAHSIAGRPQEGIKTKCRFQEWSDTIRSPLIWLGIADPYDSTAYIEQSDPVTQALKNLLSTWFAVFQSVERTIKLVLNKITNSENDDDDSKDKKNALYEALAEMAPDGRGGINERELGKKLSQFCGRVEGGFRIDKAGISSGTVRWKVTEVVQKKPNSTIS